MGRGLNFTGMKNIIGILLSVCAFAACCSEPMLLPKPQEAAFSCGSWKHKAGELPFLLTWSEDVHPEGYNLIVDRYGARAEVSDNAGVFYALQTLSQLAGVEAGSLKSMDWSVPCCEIKDYPSYGYRGLMVDVSRHFRSLDFLYKHIDAMAAVKLNRLHLHLTDAAGWRLEIKSFPRLTETAAWRSEASYSKWWIVNGAPRDYVTTGTERAYGGFYTQEEIKALVAYAAKKHIAIIPEIEMPGHSDEVCAVYPELSCENAGGEFCPGKEATFDFIFKVLDEVCEIFPGEYIHIGGDEAVKSAWKTCPDCRHRMRNEGLDNVEELQGYMMHRVEDYLKSKGRKAICWDEILSDGYKGNAAVMAWRGPEIGMKAAGLGHEAIMCPGKYCYLDAAQDAPSKEPATYGNYLSLKQIYSFDLNDYPVSDSSRAGILGLQANLWAEFVETDEAAEYLFWPRALAVAESGWNSSAPKNFNDFRARALRVNSGMAGKGYNVFDMNSEQGQRKVFFKPVRHKAVGCKVVYNPPCKIDNRYPAGGEGSLTDGLSGSWSYGDGRWQGFLQGLDVTIDLGRTKRVRSVEMCLQQNIGVDIHFPLSVSVEVSGDGQQFSPAGSVEIPVNEDFGAKFKDMDINIGKRARYIRVLAERSQGYQFYDEIIVR